MSRTARSLIRLLIGSLLVIPLAMLTLSLVGFSPMPMLDAALNRLPNELVSWTGLRSSTPAVIGNWPPVKGEPYPNLILRDQTDEVVQLTDFAGKVILVELVAIPCKGCQAFSGGERFGGFAGVAVQPGLESIHDYAEHYAGIPLDHPDVVFVQLLLYGNSLSSPSHEEVAGWARHFQLARNESTLVLQGDPSMLGPETFRSIPGFHLIDEDFMFRFDSCGHTPVDDLFKDLLPGLGQMVNKTGSTRL